MKTVKDYEREADEATERLGDVVDASGAMMKWSLYAGGSAVAFIFYLFLFSVFFEDYMAVLQTPLHAFGIATVVFGPYATYRAVKANAALSESSGEVARHELLRVTEGRRVRKQPEGLPLRLRAEPSVLKRDVLRRPGVIVAAVLSLIGIGLGAAADFGVDRIWGVVAALGLFVTIVGSAYFVRQSGEIEIDAHQVRFKTLTGRKTFGYTTVVDAVEVTTVTYAPRAGSVMTTQVHFLDDRAQQLFAMDRDGWSDEQIEKVLSSLGLKLRVVPGSFDHGDLAAMIPGSVGLPGRHPTLFGLAVGFGLVLLVGIGVAVFYEPPPTDY